MKVLQKGIMPDGTHIQIEEWHESYDFIPYGSTMASYPISNRTKPGAFAPKAGEQYRFSFDFSSAEEALKAFKSLESGEAVLSDYRENMSDKMRYGECI
jgi:hypothetical protein